MAKKKLKNYQIGLDSEVYAISVVDEPAIESDFMYFSAQKPLTFKSNEKHMLYGCVLRPDYPIYRLYDDEEFYVTFSKECVEQLSQRFLKNGFQKQWTEMHEDAVNGLYIAESWIKTDMEKDKSIALGLDPNLPLGSWFVGCKVDNEDVWKKVKDGTYKGFSVEAFISLEEFKKIKNGDKYMIQNTIDEESFLDKIKNIINDALGRPNVVEETVLEEPIVNEQPIIEEAINDVVEEKIEEKVDEIVNEEPIIKQNEEQVVEQTIVEEPKPEEIVDEVVETVEENAVNEEEVKEDLQAVIDGLNAQIASMQAELEQLRNENKKLGGMPSANPVNVRSAQKTTWETIEALRNGTYFK